MEILVVDKGTGRRWRFGGLAAALAVVVITGHASADEIEDIKRLGAVDVTKKPSALTHYHRAIERLHDRKALATNVYCNWAPARPD